ncbi:response regulator transcription factor [Roseomonas aerophila]|uniref:Response regulator transcription factor n=1 Tax=Teichococcus aerophilus TaxID=1224513 RepID=A0ABR7RRH7_9PROT|nr:response regulator transcription factor [Pseudoroseomonas aerophila]MBC9208765.1 response regulator transcription factor [Pseudoroseomonas aerophila]
MRLLLTEDDPRLATLLAQGLTRAGWAVDVVEGVEDALAALHAVQYQALVLDLGLPDGDGMEVLQQLRQTDPFLPVLILTARGRLSDRVRGLNTGADDYLIKPFAMEELVARLAAALRRSGAPALATLRHGQVELEPAARTFSVAGAVQPLPRREMMVLEMLLRARHRFVAKDALEEALGSFDNEVGRNVVEVYVSRLRRRLAGSGTAIRTERGLGYRLVEEEAA